MARSLIKIEFQFREREPAMRCVGHFDDGSIEYDHWIYDTQPRRESVDRQDARGFYRVRDSRAVPERFCE